MRIRNLLFIVVFICNIASVSSQNSTTINATLDAEEKMIEIQQEIIYKNSSQDTINEIFLHDWNNSFVSKTSPLGKSFAEDFEKRFHFEKDNERGATAIQSITNKKFEFLKWERHNNVDIIGVQTINPLYPGEHYTLKLIYRVKIPKDKFTRYGYSKNGDFSLKYWYITPAIYDTKWNIYSHKNLDDLYAPVLDYDIKLTLPANYEVYSELNLDSVTEKPSDDGGNKTIKTLQLTGKNRNRATLYLEKKLNKSFYNLQTENITLVSNIEDNKLMPSMKFVAVKKIFDFLEKRLGPYPFDKLLVSENDYKNNPVYGLNQLPDIIRPFPDGFQYEIKQLKSITETYLKNTLIINPRYDAWLKDALLIYLMIDYTDQYYPNIKILGNLSKVIGIRWFHAADMRFNDQYYLGYKNMARLFLDQSLATPQDSLVKFNKNIANVYKAGIGLKYLDHYLEDDNIVAESIKELYAQKSLKLTSSLDFESILKDNSKKDVDWFFREFIETDILMDFKIKSVKKRKDSLYITIKNREENTMPISLSAIKDNALIYKKWISGINKQKTFTIPNQGYDKLILDDSNVVPEINRRNNYRNLKGLFNRPLKFTFFQDLENPAKQQIFFVPEFDFNAYDGFILSSKFYNQTFIRRRFRYNITPKYGFKSRMILGSASFNNTHQIADEGLYAIRYGMSAGTSSFDEGLLFRRYSPSISFFYRPNNLRDNENQVLTFRGISVDKDENPNDPQDTPNYNVFNARYRYSDPNLVNFSSLLVDYQISKNFSKISTTLRYRKLFLNNRQINLRFFAGTFLFNDTRNDGDFFSFALDRPTDYLFDYNYLGRSSAEGIFSQQIILAEGGFKSKLEFPFANQWITTFNAETNIWNWIYIYGDVGYIKNKGIAPKFAYDAGVRLSLVADYFELFFPVVSNNGWEISQPNYDEKIRFIVTLSPKVLIGLFTRKWY